MPTVDKDIAVRQIAHNRKLKRPQMYCIARYTNTASGTESYKLCYRRDQYEEMLASPFVVSPEVLWASPRAVEDGVKARRG